MNATTDANNQHLAVTSLCGKMMQNAATKHTKKLTNMIQSTVVKAGLSTTVNVISSNNGPHANHSGQIAAGVGTPNESTHVPPHSNATDKTADVRPMALIFNAAVCTTRALHGAM
jgi:hypothetical protein